MATDPEDDDPPPVPFALRLAAVVWVTQGGFWVLGSAFVVGLAVNGSVARPAGYIAAAGLIVGGRFVSTGLRTLLGTKARTRGIAVGSYLAGLAYLSVMVVLLDKIVVFPRSGPDVLGIVLVSSAGLSGAALFAAGVVALRVPNGPGGGGGDVNAGRRTTT